MEKESARAIAREGKMGMQVRSGEAQVRECGGAVVCEWCCRCVSVVALVRSGVGVDAREWRRRCAAA